MIEMEMENERVERLRLQRLGEEWIRIVTEGRLDRLAGFCNPDVASRLLLPKRIVTLDKVEDLLARYDDWFGACTDFQVEGSRVERVGPRLGIFYRFLLRKDGDWHRIEQQLYCTLQDGRMQRLDLLCSGFQIVAAGSESGPALDAAEHDPVAQSLLEFYPEESNTASTCAVLTPMIKSKLSGMQSGQVLEVRVNDPEARGDVEAWSRLSGNRLLKVVDDEGAILRFFVQKK